MNLSESQKYCNKAPSVSNSTDQTIYNTAEKMTDNIRLIVLTNRIKNKQHNASSLRDLFQIQFLSLKSLNN
jgi:hypothetical protein